MTTSMTMLLFTLLFANLVGGALIWYIKHHPNEAA